LCYAQRKGLCCFCSKILKKEAFHFLLFLKHTRLEAILVGKDTGYGGRKTPSFICSSFFASNYFYLNFSLIDTLFILFSMKLLFYFLLVAIIFLPGCDKSNDVINPDNCNGLITDTLGTNDNAKINMPNAFSPNGDGLNDMIIPNCLNVTSIDFTIYDQRNTVVFSTSQLNQGWGATLTSSNSSTKYYYKIQAITSANHKIGMCGDLYKLTCRPNNTTLYFPDQLTQNGFTNPTSETLPICR